MARTILDGIGTIPKEISDRLREGVRNRSVKKCYFCGKEIKGTALLYLKKPYHGSCLYL